MTAGPLLEALRIAVPVLMGNSTFGEFEMFSSTIVQMIVDEAEDSEKRLK